MRNDLIGWLPQAGSPLTEAAMAVAQLGTENPELLLTYGPVARMNPYQALLYQSAPKHGVAVSELISMEKLDEVPNLTGLAKRTAVHLHWINSVIGGAGSQKEANRRVSNFLDSLDLLSESNVDIVFTIHNKLSHDATFIDAELALQQGILDRCAVVHSMTQAGLDSMRDFADIDSDRVIVSGHPLYENVYPNFLTREECRKSLGIRPDEFVLCLFGAIKPYKGLDELKYYWSEYAATCDGPVRLLVAGAPDKTEEAKRFIEWAISHPSVTIQPTKIPYEQVQLFVKASDAGVIPYRRTLNSGSAMLHLTFGRPIVTVNEPAIVEGLPREAYELFSSYDEFSLAVNRIRIRHDSNSPSFTGAVSQSHGVDTISSSFIKQLLSKLC